MYAHIANNRITETRHRLPEAWEHGGVLYDIRPGQHPPEAAGWHEVIIQPRPADTGTHTHESTIELIDGVPTRVWTSRPWSDEEIASRVEAEARLTDLEARIANIESKLWPPTPEDAPADDAPTWAELERPGWWMPSTLLSDGGKVWRNVSGDVLTTPPSGFPSGTASWSHLFVEHSASTEPEPDPGAQPWAEGVAYSVGALVTHAGRTWRCKLAHTSHSGWAPSDATHTVWEPVP